MNKPTKKLTVAERIDAVLTLHNAENPGAPLSVSTLAKRAGVSRANLYVSHLAIVQQLNSAQRQRKQRAPAAKSEECERLRTEVQQLRRTNKALLLLNAQLNQEIISLNRSLMYLKQRRR